METGGVGRTDTTGKAIQTSRQWESIVGLSALLLLKCGLFLAFCLKMSIFARLIKHTKDVSCEN